MNTFLIWKMAFLMFAYPMLFAPVRLVEICDNGIDDDEDGFIDINDVDCICRIEGPTSLIPNPSFEEYNCCPEMRSELSCADTWIQASTPTTDFIHSCGYMGWANLPPPLPFPDGEGCVGYRNGRFIGTPTPSWKEYAGACLTEPMIQGEEYLMQFNIGFTNPRNSPPTTVAIFAAPNCSDLPFGVENREVGCPANEGNWIQLEDVEVEGEDKWISAQMKFRAEFDTYAICIGPDCVDITSDVDIYYFLDNLLLDEPEAFDYHITFSGHPCSADFQLHVPEVVEHSYQWYKNGIALVGEDSSSMVVQYGEGEYQVRVLDENGCTISLPYIHTIPVFQTQVLQEVCPGETFKFNDQILTESGIYSDTLINKNGCDSIIRLNFRVLSEIADTFQAKIFKGEAYQFGIRQFDVAGEYTFTEPTEEGCERLIHFELSNYEVYIPNIFSPNRDGVNDLFFIQGGSDLQRVIALDIFDRWGTMVYSKRFLNPNDRSTAWNGYLNGELLPTGVYVYRAVIRMDDGMERQMTGEVLLML
ncbi:MAG: gliding motility-associated C-terminal domain-containing protein [Bacteroidota bacterium]